FHQIISNQRDELGGERNQTDLCRARSWSARLCHFVPAVLQRRRRICPLHRLFDQLATELSRCRTARGEPLEPDQAAPRNAAPSGHRLCCLPASAEVLPVGFSSVKAREVFFTLNKKTTHSRRFFPYQLCCPFFALFAGMIDRHLHCFALL